MPHHIPHLAVPFAIDRRGSARTVDQDSDAEILQCVRTLVETRPGERLVVPGYGVDDPTFDATIAVNEEWVADAAAEWEPRATVAVTRTAVAQSGRVDALIEVDS